MKSKKRTHVRAAPPPRRPDPYDHEGAIEEQVDQRGQLPQRIDAKGTKIEDLAGTGGHDAPGG